MSYKVVLASGSPRRHQLLLQAGIAHTVQVTDADETASGTPEHVVQELARRKAMAVQGLENNTIIIAADTLVFAGGNVLGKPANADEAFEMLNALQGATHEVYTGVTIVCGGVQHVFFEVTAVTFRQVCGDEMRAYIATGEPFDKAGGYGIQGRAGAFVTAIDGDFYNVVGLPIARVCQVLAQLGFLHWQQLP